MEHIAPIVEKIVADYDRRAKEAQTCNTCRYRSGPNADSLAWCMWASGKTLPASLTSGPIRTWAPFHNCPTWEAREQPPAGAVAGGR